MSRLLVVGTGPLYGDHVRMFNGQGFRTWQFTMALRALGHEVILAVLPTEGHVDVAGADQGVLIEDTYGDDFGYYRVTTSDAGRYMPELERLITGLCPDGIVAVNHNAAYPVSMLETSLPMWADLNGYMMGEAQTKSLVFGNDSYLKHFWSRERHILLRADKFSAVSRRQMYATVGELGALGRLNSLTATHGFVCHIPNAMAPQFSMPQSRRRDVFRGKIFSRDAFVLLWSGGFNTWTNVDLLADVLFYAMRQEPCLHFVATGGAIAGHDELTYQRFLDEMAHRGLTARCTMLGWIDGDRIYDLYRDCDLGLCVDGSNYETLMGARNRVTNMVAAGVPILMTAGTEISEELAAVEGALTVTMDDVEAMVSAIVYAARNPDLMVQMAQKALAFAREHWTPDVATAPIAMWAAQPYRAPDNIRRVELLAELNAVRRKASTTAAELKNPAHASLSALEEEAHICRDRDVHALMRDSRDLKIIRGKKLYRAWHWLLSILNED